MSFFFNSSGWLEHLARRRLKIPSGPRFIVPRPAWLTQKGGNGGWSGSSGWMRWLFWYNVEVLVTEKGSCLFVCSFEICKRKGLRCDWFWGFRNDAFRCYETVMQSSCILNLISELCIPTGPANVQIVEVSNCLSLKSSMSSTYTMYICTIETYSHTYSYSKISYITI